jgi:Rrf2 family protein
MNLQVSRRCDYAIRAAVKLAVDAGSPLSAADLAATMLIPAAYMEKVLSALSRAGLVSGQRGPGGGYRLTRAPALISLREVIEAAEGPLSMNVCVHGGGSCQREPVCGVHNVWATAQRQLVALLDGATLDVLAREEVARTAAWHASLDQNVVL